MMKKLLVLILVLAVGSMASATLMLSGPASVQEGADFQLIVSGLAADAPGLGISGGVYTALGGAGSVAKTVEVRMPGAGNLGSATPYNDGTFNGVDFTVGALLPQNAGEQVQDGDWILLTFVGGAKDTSETFQLYDYAVGYEQPVQELTVVYTPEPMSLLLLGLGGLFLRRRK